MAMAAELIQTAVIMKENGKIIFQMVTLALFIQMEDNTSAKCNKPIDMDVEFIIT